MTGDSDRSIEEDPLLTSTRNDSEGENETTQQTDDDDDDPKTRKGSFWRRLDMIPTQRDRISSGLVLVGITTFLPLTWYIVLRGNLKEMGWFAPHPPLQALAITSFLLGITPLQPPPPSTSVRQTRFNTHQSLILGLALPAFTLGTLSMWWNKHVHSASHFTTWHSWFGLATIGWMFLQAAVGAGSVWFGGKAFGGGVKAKRVYKYHRLSGYLLVALALFTAHLGGAHSTWALGQKGMGPVRVLAFWVGLPLIWVGVQARARGSKMKFV